MKRTTAALALWLVAASTMLGWVSGAADTCIKDFLDEECYNLTAKTLPWDPWVGEVCVEMPKSESLTVNFDSAVWWKFWDAFIWVGTDAKDIPMLPDGTADFDKFPHQKKNLKGADVVSLDITLDSKDACSAGEYNLIMASYALIGEPCPNNNGSAVWGTEHPSWGQDLEKVKTSSSGKFTYIEVPIDCDCSGTPMTTTIKPQPSANGDPHITMWTGQKYDFQGGCDLVLLNYVRYVVVHE